jgi:alanyl-tRNA synthetase
LKAEHIANTIIREGRPVRKIHGSIKEIKAQVPQVRVRWDRIKDDTVTVVEVDGFDWAACVGEHVENTKEIGYILVTRIVSVGKGFYEIEFEVDEKAQKEALNRSALAGEIAFLLRTSLDTVIPTLKNLKASQKALTESIRLLTRNVISRITPQEVKGISVYIEDVSGADFKLLQKAAAQVTSKEKNLVVFIDEKAHRILVARSCELPFDCRELAAALVPEGRGGGKPDCAVFSSQQIPAADRISQKVTQFLERSGQI